MRAGDLGAADDPDAVLVWSDDTARRILTGELRGSDALLATTACATTPDGLYVGAPAPCNLLGRAELASMPAIMGATFTAQYHFRSGPFGDVDYLQAFVDGRLADERLGVSDGADVVVDVDYRAMALVRAGEWTLIEGLEGGSVKGDLGPLAALAGLVESPEYHDAELATGSHMLALAVLGELGADPAFARATAELVSDRPAPA